MADDQQSTTTKKKTGKKKKQFKRKIVRRKPGSKPGVQYFSMDTQNSIVEWQQTEEPKQKEKIYVEQILPAFDTLVENLINVYTFNVMFETKKDLKTECLEFLYTTVGKFDHTKGSKAFSYFNVVAKNFLTIKSKKNFKRMTTYVSSDDKDSFTNADLERYESYNIVPSYEDIIAEAEKNLQLQEIMEEIELRVKTDNEKACVNAIKQIVDNLGDLEILNKRAVLLYIRELTQLSSKQLSVVLASIKKHYREIKKLEKFQ
jgi:hypothetical protein